MNTGSYFNTVEEVSHHRRTSLKVLGIFCRPPIFQVTILIILTTLIIKSMGHFMSDNYTNRSIIEGIIRIHIKERILKYTGRETDLIRRWIVICIYCLRSHIPLVLIDRFTIFADHFVVTPLVGTLNVGPI